MNQTLRYAAQAEEAGYSPLACVAHTAPGVFVREMADTTGARVARDTHAAAVQEYNELRLLEKKLLTRASPRLPAAVRLGLRHPGVSLREYEEWFGGRSTTYVEPGSVASMFSPAAYLTALYREARKLYEDDSTYHIDERRPDLAGLNLSQDNMDTEVTALSLNNDILMSHARKTLTEQSDGDTEATEEDVLNALAGHVRSPATPWHGHYARLRAVRRLRDPEFTRLQRAPRFSGRLSSAAMAGMYYDISPALYALLTEEVPDSGDALDSIYKKYFGDIPPEAMMQPAFLRRWFDLTESETQALLSWMKMDTLTIGAEQPAMLYNDNRLVMRVDGYVYQINFTLGAHSDGSIKTCYLVPLGDNRWKMVFRWERGSDYTLGRFYAVKGGEVSIDEITPDSEGDATFQVGKHYGGIFTWDAPVEGKITSLIDIASRSGQSYPFHYEFAISISKSEPRRFMLDLNKLIRLHRATGLSYAVLETLINSVNPEQITADTISLLFNCALTMKRYSVSHEDALVMCRGLISLTAPRGETTQSDRLFNSPVLDGTPFYPDENKSISLLPADAGDDDAGLKAVLKRACQTDDAGLYALYQCLTDDAGASVALSLENLSRLYAMSLWARLNGLTPQALLQLLTMTELKSELLFSERSDDWGRALTRLYALTLWLNERNWTVSDLHTMTRPAEEFAANAEILNLIAALQVLLPEKTDPPITVPEADDIITLFAPVIAATFGLPGEDAAAVLLRWADRAKPGGTDVQDFFTALYNTEDNAQAVAFAFGVAQMALIVQCTGASPDTIRLFTEHPNKLGLLAGDINGVLRRHANTVIALSDFCQWLKGTGEHAGAILKALSEDGLTTDMVALATGTDPVTMAGALANVQDAEAKDVDGPVFANWYMLQTTLHWVDVAQLFRVTPDTLADLLTLDYAAEVPAGMDVWRRVAVAFSAGLTPAQSAAMDEAISEGLSAALSSYLVAESSTLKMFSSREALSDYLLSDNRNGSQVVTSRIAEAINCLQTFIHRTLKAPEDKTNLIREAVTGQFFRDWDTWNARYSTWAGAAKLIYYPENYIDPTVRLGQTQMMDDMLQKLGQAQINTDTVGDAFMGYLSGFEAVANLETVSGYHDSLNENEGYTWFVGRSEAEPRTYWWRRVDESKRSAEGKLPANAWTGWTEITCAPMPWGECIRPVVYKKRLYIAWLERRLKAPEHTKEGEANPTPTTWTYLLHVSYLRYDGGWSVPVTTEIPEECFAGMTEENPPALHLSVEQNKQYMLLMVYSYNEKTTPLYGLYIFEDMQTRKIPNSDLINLITFLLSKQLDTLLRCPLNYPITVENFEVDNELNPEDISPIHFVLFYGKLNLAECTPSEEYAHYNLHMNSRLNVSFLPSNPLYYLIHHYNIRSGEAVKMYGTFASYGAIIRNINTNQEAHYYYSFDKVKLNQAIKNQTITSAFLIVPGEEIPLNDVTSSPLFYFIDFPEANGIEPEDLRSIIFRFKTSDDSYDIRGHEFYNPNFSEFTGTPDDYCSIISGSQIKMNITRTNGEVITVSQSGNEVDLLSGSLFFNFEVTLENESALSWGENQKEYFYKIVFQVGSIGSREYSLKLTRRVENEFLFPDILLRDTNGTQYLQHGPYRTRLNTLFARQLTERAEAGTDSILSLATQEIEEPQPGQGLYFSMTFPAYDPEKHTIRSIAVILDRVQNSIKHTFWSGMLTNTAQTIQLFAPWSWIDIHGTNFPYNGDIGFEIKIDMNNTVILVGTLNAVEHSEGYYITNPTFSYAVSRPEGVSVTLHPDQKTEPMDFAGANAIYFWELFYYTPMMVMQRFIQEQRYDQAEQWLNYVWNPEGYIVHGGLEERIWNVRPLLEDQSWNSEPLQTYDPDAVAQNDPMHYKLNAFMRRLDILIGRGDAAYRRLERDTLAEARVWYSLALRLLGESPLMDTEVEWNDLRLTDAASEAQLRARTAALDALRTGVSAGTSREELRALLTADSAAQFHPEVNDVMLGYWQTLSLRLYNLRHNLTIDGQPLRLPLFAAPADPAALLASAVAAEGGAGSGVPEITEVPALRFQPLLESARAMTSQLIQFGSTLLQILERQDAEALSELLTTQGAEIAAGSVNIQQHQMEELAAEKTVLQRSIEAATLRRDHYQELYDENINSREEEAMRLISSGGDLSAGALGAFTAGAAISAAPNIFGFANGGHQPGQIAYAVGNGIMIKSQMQTTSGTRISQEEMYRRRRQEWDLLRKQAAKDMESAEAQLESLAVRETSLRMQIAQMEMQQAHATAQLALFQNKFTGKALYSWLRGRLATIYYQFYDLTVSRCMMAQKALQWEKGDTATWIKTGTWQGARAGLMCGEGLMLSLAQMEDAWLKWNRRTREIMRTVSLGEYIREKESLTDGEGTVLTLSSAIGLLLNGGDVVGDALELNDSQLAIHIDLSDLGIQDDYPGGGTRRVRNIAVTLPGLLGPYQNVRAVLSANNTALPPGCRDVAISHGLNDSGMFQPEMNDGRWMPFEGMNLEDANSAITLSFPSADSGTQKQLLESLSDVILHISYTHRL
ncbi:Tc toxin subunit A-related protein [Enterobacter mori]